jgi:predicted dehydrogenase
MKKQFRIGIVGTENTHAFGFSEIFNKKTANGEYLYPDCHVTLVYGHDETASARVVNEYGADAIANSIEEMVKSVDAVMITARDGKFHAEFARPFIEAGIPAFIDKPFTCDMQEALELVRLAKEKGVPLVGGSSLKYADGIQELKKIRETAGDSVKMGMMSAPLLMHNEYSGFWFYASHLAEMCMEVFGWNPKSVTATENHDSVSAIVDYEDYSITCNFVNHCYESYTGVVFSDKAHIREVSLDNILRYECDAFVDMLRTGKMSHSYDELIAPVSLMSAIQQSYTTGKRVEITKA